MKKKANLVGVIASAAVLAACAVPPNPPSSDDGLNLIWEYQSGFTLEVDEQRGHYLLCSEFLNKPQIDIVLIREGKASLFDLRLNQRVEVTRTAGAYSAKFFEADQLADENSAIMDRAESKC